MRKLKLQMQVTVDGYVAGPAGQLDWMTFDMDAGLLAFISHLTDTSDTILLGRKMTDGSEYVFATGTGERPHPDSLKPILYRFAAAGRTAGAIRGQASQA